MPESEATQPPALSCADCTALAVATCKYCEHPLCSEHICDDRFAARQLFGPFLIPKDIVHCTPCYGERLCLAWRGLVVFLTVIVTFAVAIHESVYLLPIPLIIGALLWSLVRGPLKANRAQRDKRKS